MGLTPRLLRRRPCLADADAFDVIGGARGLGSWALRSGVTPVQVSLTGRAVMKLVL